MEKQYEEDEIDLLELLLVLKRHILSIIIAALIAGSAALAYSMYVITPVYTSTSNMLVMTKETTFESLADLQMSTQLTNDYVILIKARPVLEEVIFNLNLQTDYVALRSRISINNPEKSRILEISVRNSDPVLAMEIVNELARVSSEYIGDKMEVVPPKIIEEGIVPIRKTSPDHKKNMMIGLLGGAVLAAGFWILRSLLDDTIKGEEDIEKYLGIATLASVPDRKDYINERKGGSRKKKKSVFARFPKKKDAKGGKK